MFLCIYTNELMIHFKHIIGKFPTKYGELTASRPWWKPIYKSHNFLEISWGLLYQHEFTLIPAWISNNIYYKSWGEITYPFANFNSATAEVLEWINNFIEHWFSWTFDYLSMLELRLIHVGKRSPGQSPLPLCNCMTSSIHVHDQCAYVFQERHITSFINTV